MGTRNRTVAVVDDDDSVLKAIRRLLVAAGFDTVAFHRGQDFLDFVSHDPVGCVVLDIRMPEMDGLEVADRLKSLGWLIPVVFLSAYFGDDFGESDHGQSAVALVKKPPSEGSLVEAVNTALDSGQALDQDRSE